MPFLLSKQNQPSAGVLAIPKTGSTWVLAACEELGIGYQIGSRHETKRLGDFPHFTVVRSPFTWLPSIYRYYMSGRAVDGPAGALGPVILASQSFSDFIHISARRFPGATSWVFEQYTSRSELVGKTRTIRDDFHRFLEGVGFRVSREALENISPRNVSSRGKFPCEWTQELVDLVVNADPEVFEKYGFPLAPPTMSC